MREKMDLSANLIDREAHLDTFLKLINENEKELTLKRKQIEGLVSEIMDDEVKKKELLDKIKELKELETHEEPQFESLQLQTFEDMKKQIIKLNT